MHNIFICFESDEQISTKEYELIQKYWELEDKEKLSFSHQRKEIGAIFNLKEREVDSIVKKYSFISSNNELFHCKSCKKKHQIKNRRALYKYIKEHITCEACQRSYADEINKYITASLVKLRTPKNPNYISNINRLNYVGLLDLCSILSSFSFPIEETASINGYNINLTGCSNVDIERLDIMRSIGVLYTSKEITISDQKAFHDILETMKWLDEKQLYPRTLHDLSETIQFSEENFVRRKQYFINPNLINTKMGQEHALSALLNYELSFEDIEDLKKYIETTLLCKAEALASICLSTYGIERKKGIDEAFKNNLKALTNEYSLLEVYNILDFVAANVKTYINNHEGGLNYHAMVNLFSYQLRKYIEWESKKPAKKYLPKKLIFSELEKLSSQHIIRGVDSWMHLSGQQIISRWLKSPNIKLRE